MKRLIFRGAHLFTVADKLFAGKDTYTKQQMALWPELEVTVQENGRYAVWVNLLDDAELLQDDRWDRDGLIAGLEPLADEILVD